MKSRVVAQLLLLTVYLFTAGRLIMVQETSVTNIHFLDGRLDAFPRLGSLSPCISECYTDPVCVSIAYSTVTTSCQLYKYDAANFTVNVIQQDNTIFFKDDGYSYFLGGYGLQNSTDFFWFGTGGGPDIAINEDNGGFFWGVDGTDHCPYSGGCCLSLQSDGHRIQLASAHCYHERMFICVSDV